MDQFESLVARLIEVVARIEVSILQRLTEMETQFMSDFTKLQAAEDDQGAKIDALVAREETVSGMVADLNTKVAALQAAQGSGDQASIDALTAEVASHAANIQAELDKPLPTEAGSDTTSGGASTVSGGTSAPPVAGADSVGGLDTSNPSNDTITGANTVPAGSATVGTTDADSTGGASS